MRTRILLSITVVISLLLCLAWAQEQRQADRSRDPHDLSSMSGMPGMDDPFSMEKAPGAEHAMHSMESHPMDLGPHMKMTTERELKPGDDERAEQIVDRARKNAEKCKDYRVALNDGYRIFLPNP